MKTISLTYNPAIAAQAVELPLSKSVALRSLTLNAVAAACGGRSAKIKRLPDADDVKGMQRAMNLYFSQIIKIAIARAGGEESCMIGDDSVIDSFERVDIGQGGAPLRFFTALAASTPGVRIDLDCEESLKDRPHTLLIEKLREAGADISGCGEKGDRPPYRIAGRRLAPRPLTIDAGVSSQYISAMMMVAPMWCDGLNLTLTGGRIVSIPYIKMTAELLRQYGAEVQIDGNNIRVKPLSDAEMGAPENSEIPTDWSAASYFYEIAALSGRPVKMATLTPPVASLQGDSALDGIFRRLGVETRYEADGSGMLSVDCSGEYDTPWRIDFTDTPDLVPAVAVAACLAGVEFIFTGVGHLRHKETDRMAALIAELRKLGYILIGDDETLRWSGLRCDAEPQPAIATYRDHRMAMAFAPAAILYPGLRIENPEVVNKSFPGFWEEIEKLGFSVDKKE